MLDHMDHGSKSFLPGNYKPSSLDVICGRGVEYFSHSGNRIFRQTIANHLDRYTSAKTKFEKSAIVLEVANEVRFNHGQPCRFVRWCYEQQRWFEISREAVRQKVGQTLRETLLQRDPQKRAVQNRKRAINKAIRLGKFQNTGFPQMMSSVQFTLAASHLTSSEMGQYQVHVQDIQKQQTSLEMFFFPQDQIGSGAWPFSLMPPSSIPSSEENTGYLSNAGQNCLPTGHATSAPVENNQAHSQDIRDQQISMDMLSCPQVQIGSRVRPFSLMLPSSITSREGNTGYIYNAGQSLLPIGQTSALKNDDADCGFHDEDSDESELSSVGWFEDDTFIEDIGHS
jgi:hypothetical protein